MVIRLEDIRIRANHGVYDFERQNGNDFRVDVSLELPDVVGIETDRLEDTINYQFVYDVVKREMQVHSDLLEHVAGRIKKSLQQMFPEVNHISVSVSKLHPMLDADQAGCVGCSTVIISTNK